MLNINGQCCISPLLFLFIDYYSTQNIFESIKTISKDFL